MTKEQKEAIKILRIAKGDEKTLHVYQNTLNKAIETVLSMLEEKDKIIADLQKSVEQIYDDYQDVGKMAFNYSDKIEKQNKIIDLMAEKIYEEGIVWNNKEEVKQYFENKEGKEL